jgi:hypothetical protein
MMGNLMRTKRRSLDDYMYQPPKSGGTAVLDEIEPADAALDDIEIPEETTETLGDLAELPGGVGESAIVVRAPGEEDSPEMFTYEPSADAPGAWVVYPPGVPCPAEGYRVQLDHAASPEEFEDMEIALDEAGAMNEESTGGGY